MRRHGKLSSGLRAVASLAVALGLAACAATPAQGTGKTAGGSSATSGSSATGSTTAASSTTAGSGSGGAVDLYYIQGQPTHEAEILALGAADFASVLSAASLTVHIQAIPGGAGLATSLLGVVKGTASTSTLVVCACAALPAAVTSAKSAGYPLVQQETQTGANFYYSDGATSTVSPALQPLVTAMGTIQSQAMAKGQAFVTSFLESAFGESATHALQTYDSLAGKPVLASASDLTVNAVDFYPLFNWGYSTEYMTQTMTITNATENDVSGLTIPVPPGASEIHTGTWGQTWPPFSGPAATVVNGQIAVATPIPALQTVEISVTYHASSASATAWPTFTWTLPYAAQKVNVNLFAQYLQDGDGVHTTLPVQTVTSAFAVWSQSNLAAGQTITFQPYTTYNAPA